MKIVKLTKEEIQMYKSPLVYTFLKDNVIIYVGKAKNGISRPFDPNHTYIEVRELADEMHLYICEDEKEAIELETKLIMEYKPKYNPLNSGYMNLRHFQHKQINKEATKIVKDILKS